MDNILFTKKKQLTILDPNFMRKQHFRVMFYGANIIFSCIQMNTRQNLGFLQKHGHKIPRPLNA